MVFLATFQNSESRLRRWLRPLCELALVLCDIKEGCMSPQNCPNGFWYDCSYCVWVSEDKCLGVHPSMPLSKILTDTERIARLEAVTPKPEPLARYDIQHLQAQINFLEKRLIKVEARKKRYGKY